MNEMIEIVILGRGGQGGKTASLVLAESYLKAEYDISAFSEYGPDRAGAPVYSYIRVCNQPIIIHSQIEKPKFIIILDDTLLSEKQIAEYLHHNLIFLINSENDDQALLNKYSYLRQYPFYIIDASKFAEKTTGNPYANTVMTGYIIPFVGLKCLKIIKNAEGILKEKYPGVMGKKNANAVLQGYLEAKKIKSI